MTKYRWRTRLRGSLPMVLSQYVPKGERDCGEHEWYLADAGSWECYHCTIYSQRCPWTLSEQVAREFEAEAMKVRAGLVEPLLRWEYRVSYLPGERRLRRLIAEMSEEEAHEEAAELLREGRKEVKIERRMYGGWAAVDKLPRSF